MTNMTSLEQCIERSIQRLQDADVFFGHGTNNAVDEAHWIVLAALDISPQSAQIDYHKQLSEQELDKVESFLRQRISTTIPTAYITGEAWFYGMPFYVNSNVLIPRSPIAELIAERFQPWLNKEPSQVLDLCTGSGCIGIAIATEFTSAQVTISDISSTALEVAAKNVARHALSGRVSILQSDLFQALQGEKFDVIVSNPPYVSDQEMSELPSEYQHEPDLGLRAGADGLDLVRKIFAEAANHLNEDGVLIVEVGNSEPAVCETWSDMPFTWLEFEHGGYGVLLLTQAQLLAVNN